MDIIGPIIGAVVFIALMSLVREPTRRTLNAVIVDIGLAPKNAQGLVTYSTDFQVLRPIDRSKGNRRMLYEITNRGRTISFANGIFDLLHVGHVRYLQGASREADVLVVGVNSDDSARALKGEGRPVTGERERAELVSAIRGVAYVTIFREASPARLIAVIKPDVHCKGTDYTVETVPEHHVVASYGGRTAIVGDAKQHATRELLKRIAGS